MASSEKCFYDILQTFIVNLSILLQCNICLDSQFEENSVFLQCNKSGHIFCADCLSRYKSKLCPVCRQKTIFIPCLLANSFLDSIKSVKQIIQNLEQFLSNAKKIRCVKSDCDLFFDTVEDLLFHCIDSHFLHISNVTESLPGFLIVEFDHILSKNLSILSSNYIYVDRCFGEKFIFRVESDPDNSLVLFFTCFILASEKKAKKFNLRVTVLDSRKRQLQSFFIDNIFSIFATNNSNHFTFFHSMIRTRIKKCYFMCNISEK